MKRSILWPLAIVAVLGSVPVYSATVSFGFSVPLVTAACTFSRCPLVSPTGHVFVDLDIPDPLTDMSWSAADVTSYAIVFPELEFGESFAGGPCADCWGVFNGTYQYDPVTGIATASLTTYKHEESTLFRFMHASAYLWRMNDSSLPLRRTFRATATAPRLAYAYVGPPAVPIPAAVYLFMSALAGLVGIKRFARKS